MTHTNGALLPCRHKRGRHYERSQNFGKENDMEKILKAIENKKAFALDESDSRKLCEYIDGLKKVG